MTPLNVATRAKGEKQTLKCKSKGVRNKPKKERAGNSKHPHRNQGGTSRSDALPYLTRAPTNTEINFRYSIISFHYSSSLLPSFPLSLLKVPSKQHLF
ncbi:hypothetical protein CEXT_542871 [Caerostris extrusa]|uniref:Uncharacterized protein n=1 Tax=Caerostris extrusa TaxID=172846 RepID=A0AAV4Q8D6_CAEEX|nr:hypothetical protein CEXT_542871 [Caerostris extrusa]